MEANMDLANIEEAGKEAANIEEPNKEAANTEAAHMEEPNMEEPPSTSTQALSSPNYPEDFYYGIPGEPRLIARSDHHWDPSPFSTSGEWGRPVPVHIWPLGLNHPIANKYERLYPHIQECCYGLDWRAISCYRIGWKSAAEENPIVIWVFMNPGGASLSEAKELVRYIHLILLMHRLDDVQVHVAEPRADRIIDEAGKHPPPYIKSTYCVNPPVGSSIGLEGGNTVSSVGLFLKFHEEQGRTWYGALTSSQVAANSSDMFAPAAWTPQSSPHGLRVTCPANKDHQTYVQGIKLESGRLRSRIQSAKEKKAKAQSGDSTVTWTETHDDMLEEWEGDLSRLVKEREYVSNFFETSSELGRVVASSNLVQPPTGLPMMDWCLLQIDEESNPEGLSNTIPPGIAAQFKRLMTSVGHREDVMNSWLDLAKRITREHGDVIGLKEIDKRTIRCAEKFRVFHLGRSSGPAVGQVNEIRDGVRTPYVQANGEKKHVVSREYVVLDYAPVGSMYATELPPFSKVGDSGSLVVDADGRIFGILFAGDGKNKSGYPASWVTPLVTILEDIQASIPAGLVLSVV